MNDVNLNYATCLKEAQYIGHTHYVNVCNGATYDVVWGGGDWLGAIGLGLLAASFVLLMFGAVGFIGCMAYDTWRMR